MTTATTPRERPILFSAPMVRAILAGTKTQTRRAMNPQPQSNGMLVGGELRCRNDYLPPDAMIWKNGSVIGYDDPAVLCPYGRPGDRLWVRETWGKWDTTVLVGQDPAIVYRADFAPDLAGDVTWRPSIHMPRAACRIVLEITDVRVQRLQDISEDDAVAEGVQRNAHADGSWSPDDGWLDYENLAADGDGFPAATARESFQSLWETINGGWFADPWVWALTFRRVARYPA